MNIYTKLQTIQSQLNHLTKTELNKFQHYKYISEYQILTVLKPLLAETKLTLTFSDEKEHFSSERFEKSSQKQEKEWVVKYCKQVVLTNSESPEETLTYYFWACGQNTDIAKAKGSAETYAIKYFLMKFFLIPTSDNLDPDKLGTKKDKELTDEDRKQAEEILKRHDIIKY